MSMDPYGNVHEILANSPPKNSTKQAKNSNGQTDEEGFFGKVANSFKWLWKKLSYPFVGKDETKYTKKDNFTKNVSAINVTEFTNVTFGTGLPKEEQNSSSTPLFVGKADTKSDNSDKITNHESMTNLTGLTKVIFSTGLPKEVEHSSYTSPMGGSTKLH